MTGSGLSALLQNLYTRKLPQNAADSVVPFLDSVQSISVKKFTSINVTWMTGNQKPQTSDDRQTDRQTHTDTIKFGQQ